MNIPVAMNSKSNCETAQINSTLEALENSQNSPSCAKLRKYTMFPDDCSKQVLMDSNKLEEWDVEQHHVNA